MPAEREESLSIKILVFWRSPKKTKKKKKKQRNYDIILHFMVLLEPGAHFALHRLNHQWLAPLGPGKCFFGRFLLRLGRIKSSQVMSMVKFGPEALNFGYDFVILVHFLGHPVCIYVYFCIFVYLLTCICI